MTKKRCQSRTNCSTRLTSGPAPDYRESPHECSLAAGRRPVGRHGSQRHRVLRGRRRRPGRRHAEHRTPRRHSRSASLVFTSNLYSTEARAGRETFAVDSAGDTVTRLTFCNESTACDTIEAAPAADRTRVLVRRTIDSNNDGAFVGGDATVLLYQDLSRGVQAPFVEPVTGVSGVDWTGDATFVLFSAPSSSTLDDLFTTNGKGEITQGIYRNVTSTVGLIERRPRLRVDGNAGVFERIADGTPGGYLHHLRRAPRGRDPQRSRWGSPARNALPLGVRRRSRLLTRWDIGRLPAPRGDHIRWPRPMGHHDRPGRRNGPSHDRRGPRVPRCARWGSQGIVFPEADPAAGTMTLVAVAADGTNRRVIVSAPGSVTISNPRWLAETR